KHNLSAATDPTSGDDSGDGYSVGSLWINIVDQRVWWCIDNTLSNAIWRRHALVVSSSLWPAATDAETANFVPGTFWLESQRGLLFFLTDATEDAAVWKRVEIGLPWGNQGDLLTILDDYDENPSPTGNMMIASTVDVSPTETLMPDCDIQVEPGDVVNLAWNIWNSDNNSVACTKKVYIQFRRVSITDSILTYATLYTSNENNSSGHTRNWNSSYIEENPTTGRYVISFTWNLSNYEIY